MCGKGSYEEEALEFDKNLLALFRQYENNIKCELSEMDLIGITEGAFVYDFLMTIKDRLPDVLELDKRGDYEN